MAEEAKSPLDQALDLLVYAPVGLALTARDELPRLIDRGRAQISGQLALAKMFGKFAVAQGSKEARRTADRMARQAAEKLAGQTPDKVAREAADRLARQTSDLVSTLATVVRPQASTWRRSSADVDRTLSMTRDGANGSTMAAPSGSASPRSTPTNGAAAGLAIPGYDTLSASQVVQRLDGLSADELEAVRNYEACTRGRRTILSKVAQLQLGR